MARHTIDTLSNDLANFKRSVNSRLTTQNTVIKDMQTKVNTIHDFMIDAKGYERGQNSSGGTTQELLNIVKWLVLIIGGILGVKLL